MAELQQQVAEFEEELAESTKSLTELRRAVEKQMSGRKAAERAVKEAETRLSGVLSAKDSMDDSSRQRMEVGTIAHDDSMEGNQNWRDYVWHEAPVRHAVSEGRHG